VDVTGTRHAALKEIRDRLASELEEASGRDVASIARELRLTLAEIDGLPNKREESPVDDLTARRQQRRKAAGQ
jgi:hypothetical protein